MANKAALKAARDAINAKDWSTALSSAQRVLEDDARNYNALVFAALAHSNLHQLDNAQAAYEKAIKQQPDTPLARQGLADLYDKHQMWSNLALALDDLMQLYNKINDPTKLAINLQKFISLRRDRGSRNEIIAALSLLAPNSPYYAVLQDLPPIDQTNPTASSVHEIQQALHDSLPTLREIVSLAQAEDNARMEEEVKKRRMRLNVTTSAQDTKKAVLVEVLLTSYLPALYDQILNHPSASTELRRETEALLLTHYSTLLTSIPSPFVAPPSAAQSEEQREKGVAFAEIMKNEKHKARAKVVELAQGMVTLQIASEDAWAVVLDWRDMLHDQDFDLYNIKRYVHIFENSPVTGMLRVFLGEQLSEAGKIKAADMEEEYEPLDEEIAYTKLEAGFAQLQKEPVSHPVLLGHLCATLFYKSYSDYPNVVETAQATLDLLSKQEDDTGLQLLGIKRICQTALATALVHLTPPVHHIKALRLLNDLLDPSAPLESQDPTCVLAKAYIMQSAEQYEEAVQYFAVVASNAQVDDATKLEAREESAWSLAQSEDKLDSALAELSEVLNVLLEWRKEERKEATEGRVAKTYWRLGDCRWRLRDQDEAMASLAHKAFVSSLKASPIFAPAFTSLGLYYIEAISPPDYQKSSKCFQKAFELDPSQDLAALYLAEEFANDREWDLVEIIARRVVQHDRETMQNLSSSGGLQNQIAGKLAAKHAWAWKAIGAADLNAKRYPEAIQSLHSAIRGSPSDSNIWLKLGLAYRGAGKHVACLKTLAKVLELDPNQWYAQYCIGDVQRQLGLLDAAVESFESLLESTDIQPENRIGLSVVLAETRLAQGRHFLSEGFYARAEGAFYQSARSCLEIIDGGQGVRSAWKGLADSLHEIGRLENLEGEQDLRPLLRSVLTHLQGEGVDKKLAMLNSVITVSELLQIQSQLNDQDDEQPINLARFVQATSIIAYALRVLLELNTPESIAAAWFDLGLSLFTARKRILDLPLPSSSEEESASESPRTKAAQQQAIQCLRMAINQQPLNSVFWNTLGVLSVDVSPQLAQHSFIRAVELSPRNAAPWANLGIFYLIHQDYELSNKAFLRAQVLDPEWPYAWHGQASLATAHGHAQDSIALVDHAYLLANGSIPETDLAVAKSAFEAYQASPPHTDPKVLHTPFQALTRYLKSHPTSSTALHLHALYSEKLGLLSQETADQLTKAVSLLEAEYEASESPEVEKRYIIASYNLARIQIALGFHEEGQAALENVFGLLGDDVTGMDEEQVELFVRSKVFNALAVYGAGDAQGGIEGLQEVLELLGEVKMPNKEQLLDQCTVLLSRFQYSAGNKAASQQVLEDRLAAKTTVNTIEIHQTLAALAISADNKALFDTAIGPIKSLPNDQRISVDPKGTIPHLVAQSALQAGDTKKAGLVLESTLKQIADAADLRLLALRIFTANQDFESAGKVAKAIPDACEDERLVTAKVIAALLKPVIPPESEESEVKVEQCHRLKALDAIRLDPGSVEAWKTLLL